MSFVSLAEAKIHLRVDVPDEDALITAQIAAAEQAAASLMDRAVFADDAALQAAISAAPGQLASATATYTAAVSDASAIADEAERLAALSVAETAYLRAQAAHRRVFNGIVVNAVIKAAVLLIVGHLFANREDVATAVSVTALPHGAEWMLNMHRVYS